MNYCASSAMFMDREDRRKSIYGTLPKADKTRREPNDNTPRAVFHLPSGKVYRSIKEASRALGVSAYYIRACCAGQMDPEFQYTAAAAKAVPRTGPTAAKRVRCVATGEVYASMSEAAARTGTPWKTIKYNLTQAINKKWEAVE